ncbi:general secretion pathway protein [Chromatiales bacterium (ex Bugula neritina AB1)]|nr:general secretion pathway protein [Chromatiales bacterium (ex Bugula neritina AB1)]
MYEAFYGLNEKPFLMRPDAKYLYLSKGHQAALSMLEYVFMSQSGFAVITGEIGSGKTSLVRKLLQTGDDSLAVGLVSNSHVKSFEELLQWMLLAFDQNSREESKVQLYKAFSDHLMHQYSQNKRSILIIDEAHNLSAEIIEQLRMLSNLNADNFDLIQLVLVGQAALRETLSEPLLLPFVHRIAVDCHLEPLDLDETHAYIRHRLMIAGSQQEIFSNVAVPSIWEASGGIPRIINLLCDTALLFGFAEQLPTIGDDLIHDVINDKRQSLSPIAG